MIEFGEFRYQPGSQILYRGDEEILLPPRILAVLESLLKRPGRIVPKEDLLASAWEGAFVGEHSLTEAISQLRQVLGDDPQRPTYIQTVPRRGYRLIASTSRALGEEPDRGTAAGGSAATAVTSADVPPLGGSRRPGTRLGGYEILGLLGVGGMGEVYRARDAALRREVAIKLLPPEMASDPGRLRRLEREARLLAALDHPHVATIHGFEQREGPSFIVMELVEGATLADRLDKGPLTVRTSLEIALQVAQGVEAAHGSGIVHRDLNPRNVKVRPDGQVKVLDFGLAKVLPHDGDPEGLLASSASEEATRTGSLVGTAPYMSPEQARGEPVDERTDVWALGCMLYEMLTGTRPFAGPTPSDTLAAILTSEPGWGSLPAGVPPAIRALLQDCLEKDPERRLCCMAEARMEVEAALENLSTAPRMRWGTGSFLASVRAGRYAVLAGVATAVVAILGIAAALLLPGTSDPDAAGATRRIESLVVLPLTNLMNDPEQDYFVQGVHDALITDLSRIGALRVIARSSAIRYRNTDKSLSEIAEELGVDAVIEGSVLRHGDRVRINTQLIDPLSERNLWAYSYERGLEDLLGILGEVARAVAGEVEVQLSSELRERLVARQPVDPAVQEAMLRGRLLFDQFSWGDTRKGLVYFQEAIRLAPDHAPAWAWSAVSHAMLAQTWPEHAQLAREAASRALELDERQSDAHMAMGWIRLWYDWDWDGAGASFRRAMELAPNSPGAHFGYNNYLVAMGRLEESVEHARVGMRVDPLTSLSYIMLAGGLRAARHWAESERVAREGLALFPETEFLIWCLEEALWEQGRYEEALAQRRRRLPGDASIALQAAFERGGVQAALEQDARQLVEGVEAGEFPPEEAALALARAGQVDAAFAWLERAYAARAFRLFMNLVSPKVDSLRSDPRFLDLLERMGLPAALAELGKRASASSG